MELFFAVTAELQLPEVGPRPVEIWSRPLSLADKEKTRQLATVGCDDKAQVGHWVDLLRAQQVLKIKKVGVKSTADVVASAKKAKGLLIVAVPPAKLLQNWMFYFFQFK